MKSFDFKDNLESLKVYDFFENLFKHVAVIYDSYLMYLFLSAIANYISLCLNKPLKMSVSCAYADNIKDKPRSGSILSVCNKYCFFKCSEAKCFKMNLIN